MFGIIDSGDKTVANGRVFYLDAAQLRSYSGSGTTWNDLSGNGDNATLFNGASFNSNNGGSISLDGLNDYVEASGVQLGANRDTNFTVDLWLYINTAADNTIIANIESNGEGDSGLGMKANRALTMYIAGFNAFGDTTTAIFSTGTWQHIVFAYDKNNTPRGRVYVNNVKYTISLGDSRTFLDETLSVAAGKARSAFLNNSPNMRIATYMIYGRTLTDAEVGQNYNAIKSRFGL
jgi:hypothetical protein